MKRKRFLKYAMLTVCVAVLAAVSSCGDKPPLQSNSGSNSNSNSSAIAKKPYLISEATVKYVNKPIVFEFELNGYRLSVSAENLKAEDYSIEDGVLTISTDFFERENKKEYAIAYSLKLVQADSVLDEQTGVLTILSETWSDIIWH